MFSGIGFHHEWCISPNGSSCIWNLFFALTMISKRISILKYLQSSSRQFLVLYVWTLNNVQKSCHVQDMAWVLVVNLYVSFTLGKNEYATVEKSCHDDIIFFRIMFSIECLSKWEKFACFVISMKKFQWN